MRAPAGLRALACALLLGAIILRLVPAILVPSLNWGDEVFQVTEPAHRLVFGTGLVTWEFLAGIRSWLLPALTAAVMEVAHLLGGGPRLYLPAISFCFAALSMVPVACAFAWCRPVFGTWPAAAAASVCILAPELVYFGGRSSAETASAHLLVGAVYLCIPSLPARERRRGWPLCGGLACGLALALRPQILPAACVLALWPGWPGRARAAAGAALTLGGASLLDWVTLGAPAASIWRYATVNLSGGASAAFGVEPWYYYLLAEVAIWGIAAPIPVGLCLAGARRWLFPLAAAVAITAAHMLIAHKEYRFIYPALVLCAVSAGIGLAAWVKRFEASLSGAGPRLAAMGCILGWALLCAGVWRGAGMAALRARAHDTLVIADQAARLPGICGIGMGPGQDAWVPYGGYTHLHQDVPLFWPADQAAFLRERAGFNLLLSETTEPGYRILHCAGSICVSKRPGACVRLAADRMPGPPGLPPN